MKLSRILGFTFVALALMTAASIEAAGAKSQEVLVPYESTLAGKPLASGQYRVKCETHDKGAILTFLLGRKVIATVEGQVADRSERYSRNQVIYETKPDGTRVIREIRFAHPSQVIVFQE